GDRLTVDERGEVVAPCGACPAPRDLRDVGSAAADGVGRGPLVRSDGDPGRARIKSPRRFASVNLDRWPRATSCRAASSRGMPGAKTRRYGSPRIHTEAAA